MERNPYLILGIPFGSSRESANVAFVRKARLIRRGGSTGPVDMTDLTWALNRVDEGLDDPAAALGLYRVPAVAGAYAGHGPGVLHPPPESLSARAGDGESALDAARRAAALEGLRHAIVLRAARAEPVAP